MENFKPKQLNFLQNSIANIANCSANNNKCNNIIIKNSLKNCENDSQNSGNES